MTKDEWLTPPELIAALGEFDLDPCAPVRRPWPTAKHHFTILEDGLSQQWFGRVWCNPPYGPFTGDWLAKLAEHGNGVALVFARTETRTWFRCVWPEASSVLFLEGHLNFYHAAGNRSLKNCGAPCALVAYGAPNTQALAASQIRGHLVCLKRQ